MRLSALGILLVALLLGSPVLAAPPSYPPAGITCRAYLVYDLTTEETIGVHNPQARQPVASLTKLMTAILAVENMRFDGRYRLTPTEAKTFETETMRADKMLEMMLVCSNNGMCKVVSRIVADDEPNFVQQMNRRARELGLTDTQFATSSGLPGGTQYSTMWDLLKLTQIAMSYPQIRATMHNPAVELNGKSYKGTLADLYKRHPGLAGGKTGYTKAAGRCLSLWYQSRGHDYIVITFGSKSGKSSFRDAELILKHYGLYDGPVGEWK
jgi:D-alanyl-D-alanine carboxypeptidase